MVRKISMFGLGILFLAVIGGCAAQNTGVNVPLEEGMETWDVYQPKAPDGIQGPEAAKADLAALLNQGRTFGIRLGNDKYYSEKDITLYANINDLMELTKGARGLTARVYGQDQRLSYMIFKSVDVLDDRIKISPRMPLFYADLMEYSIAVIISNNTYSFKYAIHFGNRISFLFKNRADARRFADDLFVIQHPFKREYEDRLALFESKVAEYRALSVKPPVSEEQRKYIVRANAMSKRKEYDKAIDMYREALDVDPVAYPPAYFNMALLSAQMRRYNRAVSYMKQYLMLEPDAKDARSAQDKIYEWEYLAPTIHAAAAKITTDPPDAFLEVNVSDSGKKWAYIGRAPGNASFWRTKPKVKYCLIRASKPGYYTEEKSFSFESLPSQVHIELRKSDSGQDNYGYLGLAFKIVTEDFAKPFKLDKPRGVLVTEVVKDSPADEAGLKNGDIILSFAGTEIKEQIDLPRAVASTPIGETVDVTILRNGREHTVRVKVGKQP